MKITITKISRFTEDKNGNPLKTKDGRPYTRVLLRCNEYGENTISGFGNAFNERWKEGDSVDVEISKVEKNGKTYYNFSKPDPVKEMREDMKNLKATVFELEKRVYKLEHPNGERVEPESPFTPPEDEEDIGNPPF